MKQALFSCVIPVKGPRPFLDEALKSLQNQGLGDDLEIIVQDADIEPDKGQSDALNKGFAKANGEWMFWLNADDVLLPGALRKVKNLIDCHKRKPVEWIAGNTVYIDKQGKVMDVRCDARWRPWFGKKLSVWTGGPSAFFRRMLWEERGGLDVGLKYVMDIDLWTRWAKAGVRFAELNDYVWGFRIHAGSKTMGGINQDEYKSERACLMSKHGVKHETFWRNFTRMASVFDGSWLKRELDSARLRGSTYNLGSK